LLDKILQMSLTAMRTKSGGDTVLLAIRENPSALYRIWLHYLIYDGRRLQHGLEAPQHPPSNQRVAGTITPGWLAPGWHDAGALVTLRGLQ